MQKDFHAMVQENRQQQRQSSLGKEIQSSNLREQQKQAKQEQAQKQQKFQTSISILVISQVHRDRIDNQESVMITNTAIKKLNKLYSGFVFYSDYQEQFPSTLSYCQNMPKIDFVLTVGTNNTLMYTFYRLQKETTPPILAFSSEGESTLFNFTKCDMSFILTKFVEKIKAGQICQCLQKFPKLQLTMDDSVKNITCEIEIGRGKNPALVKMELYYKNDDQEEEIYIGKLWGDGLVISTALGSVSRSMALSGPIIHKKLQSLILTPVCPLSLKFRPIVLPIDCNLIIKIDQHSRAQGSIFIDGISTKTSIKPGSKVTIRKSQVYTTMVANLNGSYERTLFSNLQEFLSWGEQFSSKDYKNS